MRPLEARAAEIIREVCRGNADAEVFLVSFIRWVHWMDDVTDRDRERDANEAVEIGLQMAAQFSANPFFRANQNSLWALILMSCRGWLDSLKSADPRVRDVIKSHYHEIVWHVAFLTGGWDHMRAMTERHREFDFEEN